MSQILAPEDLIADLQNALQQRHPRPHPIRQLLLSWSTDERTASMVGQESVS